METGSVGPHFWATCVYINSLLRIRLVFADHDSAENIDTEVIPGPCCFVRLSD